MKDVQNWILLFPDTAYRTDVHMEFAESHSTVHGKLHRSDLLEQVL